MLQGFPANCPPTAIVQHMPATFTRALAARLDACALPTVTEAEDGQPMAQGHVYLAPGGERHLMVAGTASKPVIRLVPAPQVSGHRPSVDVLFRSVAATMGGNAMPRVAAEIGAVQEVLPIGKIGRRAVQLCSA
jgi:two-component system chemotaxis response regulator CheB